MEYVLRKQDIFLLDKNNNSQVYGTEILVGNYLLDDLLNIFRIKDKSIREKALIGFDKRVLTILKDNKEKLKKILSNNKYKIRTINLFPETLLFLIQKGLYKKYFQEIKNIINTIEIVENGLKVNDLIQHYDILDRVKNELGIEFALDDVSFEDLEATEKEVLRGKFYLDELKKEYILSKIKIIKLDIKLINIVCENNKQIFESLVNNLFSIAKKFKNLIVVIEGIDTEKKLKETQNIYNILLDRGVDNITFLYQGYLLNKPTFII